MSTILHWSLIQLFLHIHWLFSFLKIQRVIIDTSKWGPRSGKLLYQETRQSTSTLLGPTKTSQHTWVTDSCCGGLVSPSYTIIDSYTWGYGQSDSSFGLVWCMSDTLKSGVTVGEIGVKGIIHLFQYSNLTLLIWSHLTDRRASVYLPWVIYTSKNKGLLGKGYPGFEVRYRIKLISTLSWYKSS